MRIAVIPLSFLPSVGGAEFVVHNVVLEHRRAGFEVVVFPNFRSASTLRSLPYRCVPLWRRAWSTAVARSGDTAGLAAVSSTLRWRLAAAQRLFRPDVWHIHSAYPVAWATIGILRGELGVPVVVTSHGDDIYDYRSAVEGQGDTVEPIVSDRIRATLKAADELIAVGPKVAESYLEMGAPPDRIWTIPHGWHPERVERAEQNVSETKRSLSLSGDLVALTVAADRPEKRLDDILDASDRLAGNSRWSWVIATSGSRLTDEVAGRRLTGITVREEKPSSRADLETGLPRQEILDLYAAADVTVLPSVVEAAPTVIHESFNAGRPVVATTAAASGLINDGVDGLLVPPRRPDALAAALNGLEQDRKLLERLKVGAAARGRSLDDWATVAARHREVYASAISRRLASPTSDASGPSQ